MLWATMESTTTKNTRQMLAIPITKQMRWCNAGHIAMDHITGFTKSHWMPPSGKCLRRIALAAAMVSKSLENTNH